ncbi:MAG: hypothetical protein MZV63_12415 [Marinilabiliales bacterium]|nr:hypothetical protein [Marinilabiliales bacterium]
MEIAQKMSSMILALRRRVNITGAAAAGEDHGACHRTSISARASRLSSR